MAHPSFNRFALRQVRGVLGAFFRRARTQRLRSKLDREYAVQQVQDVYRALLRRDPDASACDKVERLKEGKASLQDILCEVVSSPEFLQPETQRFTNDQSQFGELEILLRLWVNDFARQRLVVDVGARGRERSNSYDLMKTFGWRGILFEANPNLVASIREAFAGLDYELVACAVSDYCGEAILHLGINEDVSSLDLAAASGWGPISGAINVEVKRLGVALQDRNVPFDFDLLSIDIEGEDIKVVNDLIDSTHYRPGWIVIEASYDFTTRSLNDLPFSPNVRKSYALVGQTVANLILKRVDD